MPQNLSISAKSLVKRLSIHWEIRAKVWNLREKLLPYDLGGPLQFQVQTQH